MNDTKQAKRIRVLTLYLLIVTVVAIVTILMLFRLNRLYAGVQSMQEITEEYIEARGAVDDMRDASDYLTEESREYVIFGETTHLENYLEEVRTTQRREKALETLSGYQEDSGAYESLIRAVENSDELAQRELYAMRLRAESDGMAAGDLEACFPDTVLEEADAALSVEEMQDMAKQMVFDETYVEKKNAIRTEANTSLNELVGSIRERQLRSAEETQMSLNRTLIMIVIILVAMFAGLLLMAVLVILPLNKSISYIDGHKELPVRGAAEYAYLAEAYNKMLHRTKESQEQLSFEATHDELTSLYNRKVFEEKREELADTNLAMLLVDVDYFKSFNDTYGHETGDAVLKRVASVLASCFRLEDYVCRIGGDEFAVLMQHMDESLQHVVQGKIKRVRAMLAENSDLPPITLSIGAAFSGEDHSDLFRKADKALYDVKERGRNGYAFYDKSMGLD